MKNEKEVSGLNIGSDQDIYSTGIGDLTFVRGVHTDDTQNQVTVDNNEVPIYCNETRIAEKYRELIYHPFIDHIRRTRYD